MIEQLLLEQGITVVGKKHESGKTNLVFTVNLDGEETICKVYANKYFSEQKEYEKEILVKLKDSGFPAPLVLNEGLIDGKKYLLLSKIKGIALTYSIPKGYELEVAQLLKRLHNLNIRMSGHPLINNMDLLVYKALERIGDEKTDKLYRNAEFNSEQIVFCHRDPNFKHLFFNQGKVAGIIDFEDAMMLPIEVDYASFLRDQIETKRPMREIRSFIQTYSGNIENLANYLARLYILDLGFKHGIIVKSEERYLQDINLLLSDAKLEEKISELLQ